MSPDEARENWWDDRTHLEPEHEHAWQPNYGGGHVCIVCRAKRPTSEEQW